MPSMVNSIGFFAREMPPDDLTAFPKLFNDVVGGHLEVNVVNIHLELFILFVFVCAPLTAGRFTLLSRSFLVAVVEVFLISLIILLLVVVHSRVVILLVVAPVRLLLLRVAPVVVVVTVIVLMAVAALRIILVMVVITPGA